MKRNPDLSDALACAVLAICYEKARGLETTSLRIVNRGNFPMTDPNLLAFCAKSGRVTNEKKMESLVEIVLGNYNLIGEVEEFAHHVWTQDERVIYSALYGLVRRYYARGTFQGDDDHLYGIFEPYEGQDTQDGVPYVVDLTKYDIFALQGGHDYANIMLDKNADWPEKATIKIE